MSEGEPIEHRGGGAGVYLAGVALLVAAVAGATVLSRARRSSAQSESAERATTLAAGPTVSVTTVGVSAPFRSVALVGEARPYRETTLYAKVSGYLREIRVDRGDHVTAQQVLAVIDSPEIDQQLRAAEVAAMNRRTVAARARRLAAPGVVSTQEAESAESEAQVATANVGVAEAQRGYRLVRAPFDGTVTARFADVGALLQAATGSQTSALPIVRVSQTSRLRVSVYLTQTDAAFVHRGDVVDVAPPERPELATHASVSRIAGELDPRTRTLLTEIDVENRTGAITPGSFVQVVLHVSATPRPEIPAEGLIVRGLRTYVAIVGGDRRVHFSEVRTVDNDGTRIQLLSGAQPGDRIAVNVGDSLDDGQRVQPVELRPIPGR